MSEEKKPKLTDEQEREAASMALVYAGLTIYSVITLAYLKKAASIFGHVEGVPDKLAEILQHADAIYKEVTGNFSKLLAKEGQKGDRVFNVAMNTAILMMTDEHLPMFLAREASALQRDIDRDPVLDVNGLGGQLFTADPNKKPETLN
jgi:hypothetical protein